MNTISRCKHTIPLHKFYVKKYTDEYLIYIEESKLWDLLMLIYIYSMHVFFVCYDLIANCSQFVSNHIMKDTVYK